jgi:uncharacterized protein (DUF1810 family)
MYFQSLEEIRIQAALSQGLWVKVMGMLEQNWCWIDPVGDKAVEMVFFDDHGAVFDWLPAEGIKEAEQALKTNGFFWMLEKPSFYQASGVPKLPKTGYRDRNRPVYSSGKYWVHEPYIRQYTFKRTKVPMTMGMHDIERFVDAQDPVWYSVVEELAIGHKETHWMWFIFPQLRGLGSSEMANYFGLKDTREASKYWDDNTLGFRLRSCIQLLANLSEHKSAVDIFGKIDAAKLRSCMTLFEHISGGDIEIGKVFKRYLDDQRCQPTLHAIRSK